MLTSVGVETDLTGLDDHVTLLRKVFDCEAELSKLRKEVYALKQDLQDGLIRENVLAGKVRTRARAAAAVRKSLLEDLIATRSQLQYYEDASSHEVAVEPPLGRPYEYNSYFNILNLLEGDVNDTDLLPNDVVVTQRMLFEADAIRLRQSLDEQKKRIRQVCEDRVSATEARMKAMKDHFQEACRVQRECETRISSAEAAAENLIKKEIESAAAATTEYIKKFKDEAEATIDQLSVKVSDVTMLLESAQAENDVLVERIERMQHTKKAVAAKQIQEMEQNLDLLYRQVLGKEEELATSRSLYKEAQQVIEGLQQRVEIVQGEVRSRNEVVDELDQKISDLKRDRDRLIRVHSDEMQIMRQNMEDEIERHVAEARPPFTVEEHNHILQEAADLRHSVDELETSLRDAREQLLDLRDGRETLVAEHVAIVARLQEALRVECERTSRETSEISKLHEELDNALKDKAKALAAAQTVTAATSDEGKSFGDTVVQVQRAALGVLEMTRGRQLPALKDALGWWDALGQEQLDTNAQLSDAVDKAVKATLRLEQGIVDAELLLVSGCESLRLPKAHSRASIQSPSDALPTLVRGIPIDPDTTNFVLDIMKSGEVTADKERRAWEQCRPERRAQLASSVPRPLSTYLLQPAATPSAAPGSPGTVEDSEPTSKGKPRSSSHVGSKTKGGTQLPSAAGTRRSSAAAPLSPASNSLSQPKLPERESLSNTLERPKACDFENKSTQVELSMVGPAFMEQSPTCPQTCENSTQCDSEGAHPPEVTDALTQRVEEGRSVGVQVDLSGVIEGPSITRCDTVDNEAQTQATQMTPDSTLAQQQQFESVPAWCSALPRQLRLAALTALLGVMSPGERQTFTAAAEELQLIKERVTNVVVQPHRETSVTTDADLMSMAQLTDTSGSETVGTLLRAVSAAVPSFCQTVLSSVVAGNDVSPWCRSNLSPIAAIILTGPFGLALSDADEHIKTAHARASQLSAVVPGAAAGHPSSIALKYVSLIEVSLRFALQSVQHTARELLQWQQPVEQRTRPTSAAPVIARPSQVLRSIPTPTAKRVDKFGPVMVRPAATSGADSQIMDAVQPRAVWDSASEKLTQLTLKQRSSAKSQVEQLAPTDVVDVRTKYKHGRADIVPAGHLMPRQFSAEFDVTVRQSLESLAFLTDGAVEDPPVAHSVLGARVALPPRPSTSGGGQRVTAATAHTKAVEHSSSVPSSSPDNVHATWTPENVMYEEYLKLKSAHTAQREVLATIRCGSAPLHRPKSDGPTPSVCTQQQTVDELTTGESTTHMVVFSSSGDSAGIDRANVGAFRPSSVLRSGSAGRRPDGCHQALISVVRRPVALPDTIVPPSDSSGLCSGSGEHLQNAASTAVSFSGKLKDKVRGASTSALLTSMQLPQNRTQRRTIPPPAVFQWQRICGEAVSETTQQKFTAQRRPARRVASADEVALASIGTPLQEWSTSAVLADDEVVGSGAHMSFSLV